MPASDPGEPAMAYAGPSLPAEDLNDLSEEKFNNGIREITIIILAGIVLCIGAYAFLAMLLKKNSDEDFLLNWEDEIVYRVSFMMCCFTLAVSAGSVLLLPISSISNEILHKYPHSWYIKWLNSSLIYGIWNLIFVLSNLSLFILLPFAFLFCESEGFFGYKKGLISRAKETILTLLLLSLVILGMMYVIAALIDWDQDSIERIVNMYSYLPLLYSWMSFMGVLMLSICTPLGFAKLLTLMGELLVSPMAARNFDDEYLTTCFEEDYLTKKASFVASSACMLTSMSSFEVRPRTDEERLRLRKQLRETTAKRQNLVQIKRSSLWKRTVGYPLLMVFMLVLTALSLLCVIQNIGQIVAGFKSLPLPQQTITLGKSSLSSLGAAGVIPEVILIAYLFIASLIGLYTLPGIRNLRPKPHHTSLTRMILNCALYVILSSALPLLSKILGITNFDLLGSFGKMKWLGNFYIVLLYNAFFAIAASLTLFNTFTSRVRQEIQSRLSAYFKAAFSRSR